MRSEIDMIITTLSPEEVMFFEDGLYSEWDMYENKYANNEMIRCQIEKEFGYINIGEVLSEVREYACKKTYLNALESWMNKRDYD